MYRRNVEERIGEAISHSRVVLINGPRQAGKTTLVRDLIDLGEGAEYLTFDDITTLSYARRDPEGFIKQFTRPVVIDEVQRVPEILLPIKAVVDRTRRPGSFILTGSANIFFLPRLADSLAGRMEIVTLWPLSQGELEGHRDGFVDWIFAEEMALPRVVESERSEILGRALVGGYPDAVERRTERLRRAWLEGYVTALVNRDVREIGNVRDLRDFPILLNALALRSGGLVNVSDLARTVGLPHETMRRYLSLLEALWLVVELPAWSSNLGKRLVRTPKMTLNDTGLLAGILNMDQQRLEREPIHLGQLLESFVVMEIRKQLGWSRTVAGLFHFRDHAGNEVDIVLESPTGELVGIEVKSTAAPRAEDFSGLRHLQELTGSRFRRGILLHTGERISSPGKDLHAMPIPMLWQQIG